MTARIYQPEGIKEVGGLDAGSLTRLSQILDSVHHRREPARPDRQGSEPALRLARAWARMTGRDRPTRAQAVEEFEKTLLRSSDLLEPQVAQMMSRLVVGDAHTMDDWLVACLERMREIISPWYAVWVECGRFVMRWCRDHSCEQLVFMGRDALPFYAAACQLSRRGEPGHPNEPTVVLNHSCVVGGVG